MKILIKAKNFDCGDSLNNHIETELLERIGKYVSSSKLDQGEVRVHLSNERGGFHVHIQTHIGKRILLQSEGKDHDVYVAFNEAVNHMSKRLRRQMRKLKDHHERQDIKEGYEQFSAKQVVLDPKLDDEQDNLQTETFPTIVAETDYQILTLSFDEAVMHLDLSAQNFLIFKDTASSKINLIYFRSDGHIGWIKP